MEQIKSEQLRDARVKCGLEPEGIDNRDLKKHPGLEYIYDPKYKTEKEVKEALRKENLAESEKLMRVKHKSDIDRLADREDEIFAKLYKEKEGQTFTKIKEERRKEINDYNIKTFSSQTIGVHGHELPKFSESTKNKEFWKLKEGYCENPNFKSQCEYLESIKYYKPPGEDLLLNEHRDEEPQWVDPFKKVHILEAKIKKHELIPKLTNINIFKGFDPNNPRPIELGQKKTCIHRWSTLVNQFAANKFRNGRFFDVLPDSKSDKDEEKEKELKLVFSQLKTGFKSDFMKVLMDGKGRTQSVKMKETNSSKEINKPVKDPLFQKYSSKDFDKNVIPKNNLVRSKGF